MQMAGFFQYMVHRHNQSIIKNIFIKRNVVVSLINYNLLGQITSMFVSPFCDFIVYKERYSCLYCNLLNSIIKINSTKVNLA